MKRTLRSGTAFGYLGDTSRYVHEGSVMKSNLENIDERLFLNDTNDNDSKNCAKNKNSAMKKSSGSKKENIPSNFKSPSSLNRHSVSQENEIKISETVAYGEIEKSEVLVSLLGAKQPNGDKSKFASANVSTNSKVFDSSKDERKVHGRKSKDRNSIISKKTSVDMLKRNEGKTKNPGICIFPKNNKPKKNSNLLKMSEIPGETFLVSLSKDESKELNMVKTTTGTVRGSSCFNKLLSQNYPFQEPASTSQVHGSSKLKSQYTNIDGKSKVDSDIKVKIDYTNSSFDDYLIPCNENICLQRSPESSKNNSRSCSYSSDYIQRNSKEKTNIIDIKHDVDCAKKHMHKSRPSDCLISKPIQKKVSAKGDFSPESKEKPMSSQFPLIEEILTHTSCESSVFKQSNIQSSNTDAGTIENYNQSKNPISLLKTSPLSISSLSSTQDSEQNSDSQSNIKRSERLRCRSESKVSYCSLANSQTVISTMKPILLKCKQKGQSTGSKKKKKIPSTCSKSIRKKKSERVDSGIDKSRNKSGDSTKSKYTMTREVMDGIVQSIEETASAITEVPRKKSTNKTAVKAGYSKIKPTLLHDKEGNSLEKAFIKVDLHLQYNKDVPDMSNISIKPGKKSKACLNNLYDDKGKCSKKKLKNCKLKNKMTSSKKFQKSSKCSKGKNYTSKVKKCKKKGMEAISESTPKKECQSLEVHGSVSSQESTPTNSKRARKKTRKAAEALGNTGAFYDEDLPVKRLKSKKR